MNTEEPKIEIPKLYKNKKYNLLYLLNTHLAYKNWLTKRAIENIIDNFEQKGFDKLTERSLTRYVYMNKNNNNNLDIKYSYLKELAIELNCTIDDIVEPIENIYKNENN